MTDLPSSVLVANRGEIARRILATARRLGVRGIAVYSEADADMPFVAEADDAVCLGPAPPAQSYLRVDKIVQAAQRSGAEAIHPGYGFLSENPDLPAAVQTAGLVWVGPPADAIESMGNKINARRLMNAAGVPVCPGSGEALPDLDAAMAEAARVGYPVMVKAAAGGGGIGMGMAQDDAALRQVFEAARTRAEHAFASSSLFLERYIPAARHVEIQILGTAEGVVLALGDRDCSVQRRHQKVAEETPSPGVSEELRERMLAAAVRAGEAVGYRNAGTVECLVDQTRQEFMFLEMNTRLQVEHPVTELATGLDLVEQQLRIAAGAPLSFDPSSVQPQGHALELRVYAEDPKRFLPSPGTIATWREPTGPGVRVDSGYRTGNTVTPYYDPLLAKLCVHGDDRDEAIKRAEEAVSQFEISGLRTNLPFLAQLLAHSAYREGDYDTGIVDAVRAAT